MTASEQTDQLFTFLQNKNVRPTEIAKDAKELILTDLEILDFRITLKERAFPARRKDENEHIPHMSIIMTASWNYSL